jgi:hypothetical protein
MIQTTSLLAYQEAKQDLGSKQQAVYEMIKAFGPMSNGQISVRINWPINCVTPRVKELREKFLVKKDHKGLDPNTKRTVIYWQIRQDEPIDWSKENMFEALHLPLRNL